MLKRPYFLVALMIAYFIFLSGIYIPNIIVANNQVTSNLGSIDQVITFYNSYLSYMRGVVGFVFMIVLIYGILSLEFWGFLLQIVFSLMCVMAVLLSILGIDNPLTNLLIKDFKLIPSILWGILNLYIILYFFKPEIYKLFIFSSMKKQVFDQDLVYLLRLPARLSNITNRAMDIIYTDDWREENIHYLKNTRILVSDSMDLKDQATLDELKLQLKSNANKIKKMLISILPSLRDANIIDAYQCKKYDNSYWSIDQIIETFKISAIKLCTDKRDITDIILRFSKKVDEFELLNNTNMLMQQWINSTGNESGSLLTENVEYE